MRAHTPPSLHLSLILLITVLAVMSELVSAAWLRVEDIASEPTAYIDPDTFRRYGDLVNMWILYDYEALQTEMEEVFTSIKVQAEFDCASESMRGLTVTYFEGNLETGDERYTSEDFEPWLPVDPDSPNGALWAAACSME